MTSRQTILDLFSGKKMDVQPAFSGLIHITAEGLESEGIVFHESHRDAGKMSRAAGSTFKLGGLPCAVAPLDMVVEAEAIGASINFQEAARYVFPRVAKPLYPSTKFLATGIGDNEELLQRGRVKMVCEALGRLKEEIGHEAVIGGMIPGPFTLLLFLVEPGGLFSDMKREPGAVQDALSHLSSLLSHVGRVYRDAGADFLTIHDMGGSPGFIGPARYEEFAFPAEKSLIANLPTPRVLSVCGNLNKSLHLLARTGAEAISVDQLTDLSETRKTLGDTLLFGNLDPVATLWQGEESEIREAVRRARESGVDAIWPGCDLVPQSPMRNVRALRDA